MFIELAKWTLANLKEFQTHNKENSLNNLKVMK